MNLPSKAVGWHIASIAAGAWGMAVFAQTNAVDLYAVIAQLKKTWGEVVILGTMAWPFVMAGVAAYRTYGMKQVPASAVAVQATAIDAAPEAGGAIVTGKVIG